MSNQWDASDNDPGSDWTKTPEAERLHEGDNDGFDAMMLVVVLLVIGTCVVSFVLTYLR